MVDLENTTPYLFVLYLVISSNFLAPTFNCRVQQLFNTSMFMKHILGFLTLVFFVVIAGVTEALSFTNLMLMSAGLYAWFIVSTRVHLHTWLLLITLLGIIYILDLYQKKTTTPDAKRDAMISNAKKLLSLLALIVTLVGFVIYLGEKRIEYGAEFNIMKFILGNPECKGISPNTSIVEDIEALVDIPRKSSTS